MSGTYDEAYFAERDQLPLHISLTVVELLREHMAHSVLEVGVGTGRLMNFLRENGYSVQGIDSSPIAARRARGIVASATAIPFHDSTFDCLVAVSVIEHLSFVDGQRFLSEANRVLKPAGVIFLVTPNFNSPMRYIHRERWFGYSDKTHLVFYTPGSMRRLLGKSGFDGVRFTFRLDSPSLEWPLPAFFLRLPPRLRRLVNHLLVASPVALFRDSFWAAAHKP